MTDNLHRWLSGKGYTMRAYIISDLVDLWKAKYTAHTFSVHFQQS